MPHVLALFDTHNPDSVFHLGASIFVPFATHRSSVRAGDRVERPSIRP
jgi:hypothetical protein